MQWVNRWRGAAWWSHAVMASLFWGAVAGLLLVWPALMNVVTWPVFVAGGVILSAALALAKYLHRPGTE